jgi:DNA polymerase eta
MLERYPQLRLPDGPFDMDTPLPAPPEQIDWVKLDTHVVPVSTDLTTENHKESRPSTPSLGADLGSPSADLDDMLSSSSISDSNPDSSSADVAEPGSDAPPTWHDVALSIGAELMRNTRQATFEKLGYTLSAVSLVVNYDS